MRAWPRNLAGQMALLVAIALFVAQAINAGLLLRERRALRLEQVTAPAVTRFVDTAERLAQGKPLSERGRIRHAGANPVTAAMTPEPDVEQAVREGLSEAGLHPLQIATGVHPPDSRDAQRYRSRLGNRALRNAAELVIAIRQSDGSWLVQRAVWPTGDAGVVWHLVAQTLILYGVVLLPVLWIARRIARPLRDLTIAAEHFGSGDGAPPSPPMPPRGPHDVAALVDAFNALRLRVTGMLDEKDRMLGAIGHDLRTPLAALRVRVESVDDETDRARMAAIIAEMNQTLDDILSLARIGRPGEPAVEVDLPALVDAVAEDFRDLGHDVAFDDPGRLTVTLRPALMRRAVRNLIENAIKYGSTAAVSVEPRSDAIAIVVADQGPGIPEERMDEVFDPFTRLESSRNRDTGGIGLGLALARAIVNDAGGTIILANRHEGGLAATIALPRRVVTY